MSTPLICVAENGVSPNDIDIGTKFYLVIFLIYLFSLPRKLCFISVCLFGCFSDFLFASMIT